MDSMHRRDFLRFSSQLAIAFGLGSSAVGALAQTLSEIAVGRAPVLWLQGQSCSGCSVALLNSESIPAGRLLSDYVSLQFHHTLSSASGAMAIEVVNRVIEAGNYLLVVEGSVPAAMPRACTFGEEPFGEQLTRAATNARAVLCVGSCAAWGGIPAAEGNPSGATNVPDFLKAAGVAKPTIRLPGCPAHPDWVVGTLAHVLRFGLPPLDDEHRPVAFYGRTVHDQCPRFADYEREQFARRLGDPGCLFKLGCAGPLTKADCTLRGWNGGVNHCVAARSPCVGCAGRDFAARRSFTFYRKTEATA